MKHAVSGVGPWVSSLKKTAKNFQAEFHNKKPVKPKRNTGKKRSSLKTKKRKKTTGKMKYKKINKPAKNWQKEVR